MKHVFLTNSSSFSAASPLLTEFTFQIGRQDTEFCSVFKSIVFWIGRRIDRLIWSLFFTFKYHKPVLTTLITEPDVVFYLEQCQPATHISNLKKNFFLIYCQNHILTPINYLNIKPKALGPKPLNSQKNKKF